MGREKRALVVLGDALEKWEDGGAASRDGSGSSRHEAFFDRGVIRYLMTFLRPVSVDVLILR